MGLNVIPCKDNSKIPAIAWKEFQNVKYGGGLAQNNAIICGVTSGNLLVIDLDDPSLANLVFQKFDELKTQTLVVATGKKGYHVYFRTTGVLPKTMRLSLADGRHVDIQSQGSYVIAPDSIHPDTGRKYEIISSTTQILQSSIDGLLKHLQSLGFQGVNSGLPSITEIISGVAEGNRNNSAFKYCAHLIGRLNLPEEMVWAEIQRWNSYLTRPLPYDEILTVFKSAKTRVQRPTETDVEYNPEKLYKLRELGANLEGVEVEFAAMVARVGEQVTVTTLAEARCAKCQVDYQTTSEGFVNPKMPRCSRCRGKTEQTKIIDTVDMKEIYLQELQEEANYNNPIIFKARVIGKNINNVGTAQRKKFRGIYTSFNTEKKQNEVIILISSVEEMEENVEITLPPDKLEEISELLKNPDNEKRLFSSLAAHIQGHLEIKESLLYAAVSGSKNTSKRTRIHIALIGNKSKGKSELAEEFAKITGGTYLVGISTTKAGLGTGMVKLPDGTSISKAGPLVIYSGKSVALDEFDKMDGDDQKALYDCMEQGIVTSAKASIVGEERLIADTTILAAMNFKFGDWDANLSTMENINIYPALLSRFAMLWRILEYSDVEVQNIADSVLGLRAGEQPLFSQRELRLYINSVKNLTPTISTAGKELIKQFFMRVSKKTNSNTIPMEIRQLNDLIRLSTARAKILLKNEADVSDVQHVISLFQSQLKSWGIDIETTKQGTIVTDEKMGKEHLLLHLFKSLTVEGLVDEEPVVNEWMKTKYFENRRAAMQEFNRWIGVKILRNRDGKYYLAKGYV